MICANQTVEKLHTNNFSTVYINEPNAKALQIINDYMFNISRHVGEKYDKQFDVCENCQETLLKLLRTLIEYKNIKSYGVSTNNLTMYYYS